MTLIAVMDCGDSLLMGSDSLVTEETGLRVIRQKLWLLKDRPVAFGFSGDEGVGFRFRDWLLAQPWSADVSWTAFSDTATQELSRLNGIRRENARLARVEAKADDVATVLIAGSLGQALDVWELTESGGSSSVKHRGFAAIGSGFPHAYIAYRTLTGWAGQPHSLDTMAIAMEIGVRHAPMCDFPLRLLRLTPERAVSVHRQADGTWHEEPA